MSEKYRNNNNSDNPLPSRRTDGGKNKILKAGKLAVVLKPGKTRCWKFASFVDRV